jgi:pimeloyl-ACP methyl ester carboxylesterase
VPHSRFTPEHRGGEGPPLLLLHGFTDTWRTWELVLPGLQHRHEVLAPTLAGHAGGPPLCDGAGADAMLDGIEAAMDASGFGVVDVAGNSLGGYLALRLAARGRARSVVALAPAGGWADGDPAARDALRHFILTADVLQTAAVHADQVAASAEGRRRATQMICVNHEHLPPDLVLHEILGAAGCTATRPLVAHAREHGWPLDPAAVTCPIRIVWGTADRLLSWPQAAARHRDWFPAADWVVLDDVGHCIQLDVPAVAADLIDGFTTGEVDASPGLGRPRSP